MGLASIFVLVFFAFSAVYCAPQITPCRVTDSKCILTQSQLVYKAFIQGDPSLGIESSDPQTLEEVSSDLAGLKYNLMNITTKGFKNCNLQDVKMDLENENLKVSMTCALDISGLYEMNGRLIVLPIQGKGTFTILSKKILININSDLKKTQNKEGKTNISIKKFTLETDALEAITFDFKNLFNGNKALSEGVHKFANENYKVINKEFSGPLFNAGIKKMVKYFNKYIKHVPLEDTMIQ